MSEPTLLAGLFSPLARIPHGVCLTWDPVLVWTLAASHLLVGLAYFAIPTALVIFMRRQRGLKFNWMFGLFGAFIFACGTTHFISLMNIWRPFYGLEAIVMAITAVVSVATAATLIPLIPVASRFLDNKAHTERQLIEANTTLKDQMERFFDLAVAQRESQAELLAVQNASPLGLFRTDARGECTYVNHTYERICGRKAPQLIGNGWVGNIHSADLQRVAQEWQHATDRQAPFASRYRMRRPDGVVVWVSSKAAPMTIESKLLGYVGTVEDVSALHTTELALQAKQKELEVIADALPMEISLVDREERLRFANLALCTRLATPRAALEGRALQQLLPADDYAAFRKPMARALAGERVVFEQQHHDGHSTETTLIPAFAPESQEVVGVHAVTQDTSAQKAEEARLIALSLTDSLTGLGNRAGFEHALKGALERRLRSTSPAGIAVLFVDVDHLKAANDNFGHGTGDALLQGFAQRLRDGLRVTDYCARLGGDEFTVVMENVKSLESARIVCEKLMAELREPHQIAGVAHTLTASFGLACHLGPGAVDAEALVKQADQLLYAAKESGRNAYRLAVVTGKG